MTTQRRDRIIRSLDLVMAIFTVTLSSFYLFAGEGTLSSHSPVALLDTIAITGLAFDLALRALLRGSLRIFLARDALAAITLALLVFLADWNAAAGTHFALQEISAENLFALGLVLRALVMLLRALPTLMSVRDIFSNMKTDPSRAVTFGFAALILGGALLLSLPQAFKSGQSIPFIDSLFTSASCVCVTGLASVDPGTTFSTFGLIVMVLLIQVGGLGIMTLAVLLALLVRERLSLREQSTTMSALDVGMTTNIRTLVKQIVKMTLAIEMTGAAVLFVWHQWLMPRPGLHDWLDNLGYALYHAISAFCNAGFSTNADNLIGYAADPVVNAVIMTLIVTGGIGFVVIAETKTWLRGRLAKTPGCRLSLHSRLVIATTVMLIVVGAFGFYALEYDRTLASHSTGTSIMSSVFQSITPRTAGFNTVDFGLARPATLLFIIALMFIGASPGSTGGGIKTTTFAVIWFAIGSIIRNRSTVDTLGRTIPRELVNKSLAITGCFLALIFVASMAILVIQPEIDFIKTLFEVVSASATVGLSTGITPQLEPMSKLVLIIAMFLGRIGPLTLIVAFGAHARQSAGRWPREKIMVG